MLSIVKAGYCSDLESARKLSADEVFDIIEFEDITADIEHHITEKAQNGGN